MAERLDSFEGITLGQAHSVSLTIYLDSPTDVTPVEVVVNVARRLIEVAGDADEAVLTDIRAAVGKALEVPVTREDWDRADMTLAPFAVSGAAVQVAGIGWSSGPHALAAIFKAASGLDLEGCEVIAGNPGWEPRR